MLAALFVAIQCGGPDDGSGDAPPEGDGGFDASIDVTATDVTSRDVTSDVDAVALGDGGAPDAADAADAADSPDAADSSNVADASDAADAGDVTDADANGDGCVATDASHAITDAATFTVSGDPGDAALGYGDPSVTYQPDAAAGFMTYTRVAPSLANTRWATSTDHGATWTYGGEVNAPTSTVVITSDPGICGGAVCAGTIIHEVSTIVEDPTDVAARRFKVFTHSYFAGADGKLHYELGTIDLWTSPTMSAGATFTKTRLLGWNSSSSQSSSGVTVNLTTDAAMAPYFSSCIFVTEPGAIVRGGTIDMVLGCFRYVSASDIPIDMIMIRSTDHGATWKPVAKLLDKADALALGAQGPVGPQMNGGDLFEVNGTTYLYATPNGPVTSMPIADGYRGCVAIPFADVDAGVLARCDGKPAVVDRFQGAAGLFNGACIYREGASAAGVMGLTADVGRSKPFQLFATKVAGP